MGNLQKDVQNVE